MCLFFYDIYTYFHSASIGSFDIEDD